MKFLKYHLIVSKLGNSTDTTIVNSFFKIKPDDRGYGLGRKTRIVHISQPANIRGVVLQITQSCICRTVRWIRFIPKLAGLSDGPNAFRTGYLISF